MNAQELLEKVKAGMHAWCSSSPGHYIIAGEWGFDWDAMHACFKFDSHCRCALSTLLSVEDVLRRGHVEELTVVADGLELSDAQVLAFVRGFDGAKDIGRSLDAETFFAAGRAARDYAREQRLFESEVG